MHLAVLDYENSCPTHYLQHLHDICVVWPSEVQGCTSLEGHSGELADSFSGVLFSGACQPYRPSSVYSSTTQDGTRGDHTSSLLRFFSLLLEGAAQMELYCRLSDALGSCLLRLSQVVVLQFSTRTPGGRFRTNWSSSAR